MKIRINLLPYREARRKEARQRFWLSFGVVAAAGVVCVLMVHGVIAASIASQNDRNAYIGKQNADLDQKITEIKTLRESIDQVKAQQEIIGKLQSDRAATGQIMDQMVRLVPDGIYLTSMKQTSNEIVVVGNSQSADLVAGLITALQSSPYLEKPELIEIKAVTEKNRRYQNFSLKFSVKPPAKEEEGKDAKDAKKGVAGASAAASAPVAAKQASGVAPAASAAASK